MDISANSSSGWGNVYLTLLFLYFILPSLLPALIVLVGMRIKYGIRPRLLLTLSGLILAPLLISSLLLKSDTPDAYFLLAYIVPAIAIDTVILTLVGAGIRIIQKKSK